MKRHDPKGYYKALRVEPTASAEEVKRAFRSLALECHPDRNPDVGAAAQFTALSEAYAVLSEPRRRARYDDRTGEKTRPGAKAAEAAQAAARDTARDDIPADAQQARTKPEPAAGPAFGTTGGATLDQPSREPVQCACCNRPTAQPRQVSFTTVISIVVTWRRATQGVYCAACAGKISLRCSAISAAFGWWGFLGVFWTPIAIWRNALGGQRAEDLDANLLWHNALAFLFQGKLAVAHALARQVATMKSAHSLDAADMLSELHRAGVPRDTPGLVDPWRPRALNLSLQAVLAVTGPVMLTAMILFGARPLAAFATPAYAAVLRPMAPVATAGATVRGVASHMTLKVDTAPPPPTCAAPPSDGALLDGRVDDGKPGHHMEIDNSSDGPAIIKVRDPITDRVLFAFFVGKGGHAKVGPLPDGAYRIQYAVGPALAEDCKSLTSVDRAQEFADPKTFVTQIRKDGIVTQTLAYTLFSVADGDSQSINAHKFLSE